MAKIGLVEVVLHCVVSLFFQPMFCWFHGSSFKGFLLFFLLPDWLELNHLKSRMECGFSNIFSRHICSTVEETIGVTNNSESFGAKNVQKTTFEAAEMILGPWNQRCLYPDNEDDHENVKLKTLFKVGQFKNAVRFKTYDFNPHLSELGLSYR